MKNLKEMGIVCMQDVEAGLLHNGSKVEGQSNAFVDVTGMKPSEFKL
jgi:hypothetical protein